MHAGSIQLRSLGILLIGVSCSYIACSGGGASSSAAPPAGSVSVSVSPASPSITTGTALNLSATISGTSDNALVWTVDNVAGGNAAVGILSGTGTAVVYTAPAAPGTHLIRATSQADSSKSGSTSVQVNGPTVTVAVAPASATVLPSATCALSATVTGASNASVTWDVDGVANGNSSVGTLSLGSGGSATYTAPAAAGSHVVTATSVANANQKASSAITVASGTVSVAITPVSATVRADGSQSLTATVSGSSNTAVSWSVDGVTGGNSSVGTVSGSGNTVTYLAPSSAGSHSVLAVSAADTTKSASASLSVATSCAPAPTSAFVADVKAYGAKGDGVTDDTAAIQSALNACAGTGGTVSVPAGTYMINALTSLYVKSSTTFSLAPGAVLKAITNSSTNYAIVKVSGASQVNILGGTIQGERATHTGTGGEWGHGIVLVGAQHVVIEGVVSRDCWGDGLDVASSSDVTLCGVTADHNRRQGMSITSVSGMVVRNCTFENTTGTLPEDGIDIEPNPGETVASVLITGCSFLSNAGFGVEVGVPLSYTGKAWVTGTVVDGNTCTGNGVNTLSTSYRSGIEVSDTGGVQITNNNSSGNVGYGILLRDGADTVAVSGNTITGNASDGIQAYSNSGDTITGNTVTGNKGHGIYTTGCSSCTVSNNTVSGNALTP